MEMHGVIRLATVESMHGGCPYDKSPLSPNKAALLGIIVHLAPTVIRAAVRRCEPVQAQLTAARARYKTCFVVPVYQCLELPG